MLQQNFVVKGLGLVLCAPVLPLNYCVIWGKAFELFEPRIPCLLSRGNNKTDRSTIHSVLSPSPLTASRPPGLHANSFKSRKRQWWVRKWSCPSVFLFFIRKKLLPNIPQLISRYIPLARMFTVLAAREPRNASVCVSVSIVSLEGRFRQLRKGQGKGPREGNQQSQPHTRTVFQRRAYPQIPCILTA